MILKNGEDYCLIREAMKVRKMILIFQTSPFDIYTCRLGFRPRVTRLAQEVRSAFIKITITLTRLFYLIIYSSPAIIIEPSWSLGVLGT